MTDQSESLLLTEHIRKHAIHLANKTAVVEAQSRLTYAELGSAIDAVASGLIAAGISKGDRIATAMRPSIAHMVLILACMAAGAIPCALNIRLTPDELATFLKPVAPSLILTDPDHRETVSGLDVPVMLFEGLLDARPIREKLAALWHDRPLDVTLLESDAALIIPTGGTTGLPKGAVYTHRGLYLLTSSCSANFGRRASDVELFFSPFFHVSIVTGWMTSLFVGGTIRILPAFSVDDALTALETGATYLTGAPTMYNALRGHPDFERIDRSRVRSISVGAMAITPDFTRAMIADYPCADLLHAYGATEFGPVTVMVHGDFLRGRTSGVGRIVPGCRITVVDEALRPLPAGETGELIVACPWQTVGYWGQAEETAATYTGIGIRLGDLGRIEDDGWVTIAGRKKEMIISGGENVFPNEVERMLSLHPSVRDIVVYGAVDPYWGERIEAAIVLEPGASLTLQELNSFGRTRLGSYKLPKAMRIVDAVPLTAANKPDRRRLSAEAASGA